MLALDSCIVIGIIKNPNLARRILRLFKGNHSCVVLQDIVPNESKKILHMTKEDVLQKIGALLRKEVCVFATTEEMKIKAKKIESKYDVCHYPDSLILSAAKMHSWTLLSLDRSLLMAADFEGILALNPLRRSN